jgi:flagellar motor switch protein FliN/FliY
MPDTPVSDPSRPAGGPFSLVPIEIRVSIGSARPLVRDLLALRRDAVLPLDRRIDDPVDLFVGDRLIGRGELVETDDGSGARLAVRLIEVTEGDDAQ